MEYKTIDYPRSVGVAPEGKEAVLSVRDLAISFKTDEGYVHAVRGVAFDLYKEETLCIVGESGSGKSVTNKAIMGILARTKVSEEEFHRIRGTKIGMIFQDPLSSLNPIMKIGKQMTEVMIINGNHLKRYYNDLINAEFIAYKNDLRLLSLEKEERKILKSRIKDEQKKAKKEKRPLD